MEIDACKPKDPEPYTPELTETKAKPGEASSTSDAKSKAVDLDYTPAPTLDSGKNVADFIKKTQEKAPKNPQQQHDACVKRYGSDGEIVGGVAGKLAGNALFKQLGAPLLVSVAGSYGTKLLGGAAGQAIGEKIGEKSCGPKPAEPNLLPNVPNPDANKAEAKAAETIKSVTKWYDELTGAAK